MEEKLYEQNGKSNNNSTLAQTVDISFNDDSKNIQPNEAKKNISVWIFVCHFSNAKGLLLIAMGTLGSIISAISGPIMSYNFGGAINDFSDVYELDKDDPSYDIKIQQFVDNVKKVYTNYLILGTILFMANFIQAFGWQYSAFRQIHTLKNNYFNLIMSQEQSYFDNNNAFELVTKVQTQIENIECGLGDKFGFVIQKIFTVISGLVISFLVNVKLSLIVLTISPITIFLIFYFTSSLKKSAKITKSAYEKAGGIAEEVLYNIQTICSFGNFDFEKKRFNLNVDDVYKCGKEKAYKYGFSQSVMCLCTYIAFTVAIFYGKTIILDKEANIYGDMFKVGDMLTVVLNMNTAVWSFTTIAPNLKIIIDAINSTSDYFQLLTRQPKIHISLNPIIKERNSIIGKIEFKNVTFSYDGLKKILNGFSLKVTPGKKIALVGESGCGKSTVVNLLERIYEVDDNEYEIDYQTDEDNDIDKGIFLDDVNINNYDLEFYRSLIGYVQQEPVLFNKSIRENIIFGREEQIKQMNLNVDSLIKEACDLANVTDFLSKLDGKLDYKVGIKGSKLSGGQKQRIAIARAILLNPKILILDEATSALDYKNELEVQKALDNLKYKNITTFVISHRLCTIINSDMIYFMKEGRIVEGGKHKYLFFKNGLYTKLIQNQVDENGNLKINEEKNFENEPGQRRRSNIIYQSISKKLVGHRKFSLKQLFQIIKDKSFFVKLGIISSILLGITETLTGYIFGFVINALSETEEETMIYKTNFWGTLYIINALFIGIFMFIKLDTLDLVSSFLTSNLRKMIFKKYLELHMAFFDKIENSPGALLTKLSMDTIQLNSVLQMIIGDLFHSCGSLIMGIVLAVYYDWRLTIVSFFFIPFIIGSKLLISLTKRSGRESYKIINIEAGSILSESVLNTKTIFSFNFQKKCVELYNEVLKSESTYFIKDSVLFGIFLGFGTFCSFANHAALFYFSKNFFINGTLEYENMNITIQILILMTSSISNGLRGIFDIKTANSSFKSIFKLLDTDNEIDHTPEANKDKIRPDHIKGKIEFRNVYFKYPVKQHSKEKRAKPQILERIKYSLKDVSFTVEPGQKVALVGYSGSGKSTVIKLLERFYEADKGSILIDGINIEDYNLYELRKKIGLVGQEPVLFRTSIFNNIKYGNLEAKRESIFQAARDASIEYLLSLENNINNAKDNKNKISGGEKQRVSIARAFLRNPKILLLDEPTSALDKKNEIEITKSLDRLSKGRTTFIVTHRLDSIIDADLILVFENGRLIQQGTHRELINVEGEYKRLFALN